MKRTIRTLALTAALLTPVAALTPPAQAATYTKHSAVLRIEWNATWGVWGNTRVYWRQYAHHKEVYGLRETVDATSREAYCGNGPFAFPVTAIDFRTTIPTGLYSQDRHVFNGHVPCHSGKVTTSYNNIDSRIGETYGTGPVAVQQWERKTGVDRYSGVRHLYLR